MSRRPDIDYTWVLLFVGVLLFCVPLFDMWKDVYVGGKTPVSTLFENSVVVLLSCSLLWASLWLRRTEWDDEYVQLVARWSVVGIGCVTLAYAWVLGFQVVLQNEIKPYIIVADGIVIAGLVLFVAGVYNARSQRESDARAAERDRFSALFDNTSDAVAAVSTTDDTVITAVSDPFAETFQRGGEPFEGRPFYEMVANWSCSPSTTADPSDQSIATRLRTLVENPDEHAELRLSTTTGDCDYLVVYVPIGDPGNSRDDADGFFIFTDITAQRERERQFELLSERTEGLLDARSAEGVVAATRTLVVDLFDDMLVGIWRYDPETDAFHPLMTAGGGSADLQPDDIQSTPALDSENIESTPQQTAFDGDSPRFDTDILDDTLARHEIAVTETTTEQLAGRYMLTISHPGAECSKTVTHLLDLLVANTQAALRSIEREEALSQRNDQLEFVNSLLRHDIQNSMTIIRARGQFLAESNTEQEADYAQTIVRQSDEVITLIDKFRVLLNALTDANGEGTKPVDLAAVLREEVEKLRTTYPESTVTANIPEERMVVADDMLGNVLSNILNNAIEHNDSETPTVDVSVTEREQRVTVRIADNGSGVPEDKQETIFRLGIGVSNSPKSGQDSDSFSSTRSSTATAVK